MGCKLLSQKENAQSKRFESDHCFDVIISNTRNSVSLGCPNTETRSGLFLTKFEVFGKLMKHRLKCLIYLLNGNKNVRVKGRVKSLKSMLIKTGYPNFLYACDFLCFTNVMNY